jgi:iron complex transport system permease protein
MMTTDAIERGSTRGAAGPPAAPRGLLRRGRGRLGGLLLCVAAVAAVGVLSLAVGSRTVPLDATLGALTSYDASDQAQLIVREVRGPRTLIGLMAGVALGLAGAVMQGVTRNPLAEPGILGVNAGAALAAAVAVTVLGIGSLLGYIWFAFAGAGIAAVLVFAIGSLGRGGATPVKLAITGAAVTALLVSLTTLLVLRDLETLDALRFWLVGSLSGRGAEAAAQVWPFVAAGTVMALACGRLLNALSLGDDVARSLGQRVAGARAFAGGAGILLAGAATAVAGPITFVGLTIPHVARTLCGPDYRWILPYSAVLGPVLLLGSDIVGRVVARPAELQVGIVTALVGAPFFIALVRRRRLAEL